MIPDLGMPQIPEEVVLNGMASDLSRTLFTVMLEDMGITLQDVHEEALKIARGEWGRRRNLGLPFRRVEVCAKELFEVIKKLAEEKKVEPDNKEV